MTQPVVQKLPPPKLAGLPDTRSDPGPQGVDLCDELRNKNLRAVSEQVKALERIVNVDAGGHASESSGNTATLQAFKAEEKMIRAVGVQRGTRARVLDGSCAVTAVSYGPRQSDNALVMEIHVWIRVVCTREAGTFASPCHVFQCGSCNACAGRLTGCLAADLLV